MWSVLAGLTEFSSNYCSNCLRKWSKDWRGNRTPRLRISELSDDNTLVIPSNARDLGSCLHDRYLHRRQVPRSLALLGMTILLCNDLIACCSRVLATARPISILFLPRHFFPSRGRLGPTNDE